VVAAVRNVLVERGEAERDVRKAALAILDAHLV
jgi:hypothetical protein